MDKSFIKKIIAVVLGLALIIMIFAVASLIIDAVFIDDLIVIGDYSHDILQDFMKWSAVGLVCVLIPTLACYVFAFLGKRKILTVLSATFSFVLTLSCVVFLCIAHSYAMIGYSAGTLATVTGYFSEVTQICIASLLVGIYFTVTAIRPAEEVEYVYEEVEEDEED